ncbi:MAG TPA: hypothetical protein VMH90_06745 [Thermoplasmata archaeon]|nr:hypothetical protein [Thermoplasmata archaeon]
MVGSLFGGLIGAVRSGTMSLYSADLNANPGLLNRWYRSSVTVSGRIEVGTAGISPAGWTVQVVILVSPGGTLNNGPFEEVGQFDATSDQNGDWSVQEPGDFDNRDTLTFNVVGVIPPGGGTGTFDSPAGSWYDPQAPGHPSPWPSGGWIEPVTVYADVSGGDSRTGHHGRT